MPRRPDDFYRTPAWCVEALLSREAFPGEVLDPCCGDGAVLDALLSHWRAEGRLDMELDLMGVELDPGRADRAGATHPNVWTGDFLSWNEHDLFERVYAIVTNPPYSLAAEFVEASLETVAPGGKVAMLLRQSFFGSCRKRLDVILPGSGLRQLYMLPKRPSFCVSANCKECGGRWSLEPGVGPYSHPEAEGACPLEGSSPGRRGFTISTTDNSDYCWAIWEKGWSGPVLVEWLHETLNHSTRRED